VGAGAGEDVGGASPVDSGVPVCDGVLDGRGFDFFLIVPGSLVGGTVVGSTIDVVDSGTVEVVVVVLVVGDFDAADVAGTDGTTSARTTRNISAYAKRPGSLR
jgi:hypothetical protein